MKDHRTLIVCEWCLKYMRKARTLHSHLKICRRRKPPGTCIYNHGPLSVFEVSVPCVATPPRCPYTQSPGS